MAEVPRIATCLLDAGDYAGFAAFVAAQGWGRSAPGVLADAARGVHRALSAVRHPPGPTPAYLTLLRLVEDGHLDAAALDAP